ncbi:MAG: O-antigen ligase family protein [Candidatus Auribacterota bacterium]|jgi:O-antigen ligase/Flp pilus assembly protein TadD|nr:O-antigen ligase family protein [Candidatus Auribacterota bacterium]
MLLIAIIIALIPIAVYPEPLLGPFKNEYIVKQYIIIITTLFLLGKPLVYFLKTKTLTLKNTDKFFMLFLAFASISYFINRPVSYVDLLLHIGYAAIFITISHKQPSQIKPYVFCLIWIISLGLSGIAGLFQYINHKPVVAMLGNRNFYGSFTAAGLPFLIYAIVHHIKTRNFFFISLEIFLICLSLFNLICTRSRGAVLIIILQIIGAVAVLLRKPLQILVVTVVLLIVAGFSVNVRQTIKNQLEYDVRPFIWEGTFNMICDHPFIGVGPGNFYIQYPQYRVHDYFLSHKATDATRHAHNELLETWAETGSLGLLALLGIIIQTGYSLVKKHKRSPLDPFLWCLVFSTFGILLHNMVDVNMRFTATAGIFWVQLAILSAYTETGAPVSTPRLPKIILYAIWVLFVFFCGYIIYNSVINSMRSHIDFQKGIYAKESNDWESAVAYYNRGIQADPSNLSLLYHLGFAYDRLEMTDLSIATYNLITQLAPYYASVRKNLGVLYIKKKDFSKALEEYKIQQMLDPYDPDIYLNMAYCYNQLALKDKASAMRSKSLDAYKQKATLYIKAKRPLLAIPYLETALQLNSGDDETIKILMLAYLESGNKKNAMDLFHIFNEYFPDKISTINYLNDLIQSYR